MKSLGDPDRRIRWTLLLFVVVFLAIAGRAAFLQTVNAAEISRRVDLRHVEEIDTPAHRGTIFDRNGNELAVGIQTQTVTADPKLIANPQAAADALAPVLGLDAGTLSGELSNKDTGFVYLARKVDPAVGARVDQLVKNEHLAGIETRPEEKRVYPQNQLAAQVIGYTGTDNKGLAGMELELDGVLRGKPGRQRVITAGDGSQIKTVSLQAGVPGADVWLTIDESIQYEAEKVLTDTVKQWKAAGAEAVVMNPRTGEIYAMASVPTVDANQFPNLTDEQKRNHPVVDAYEPGSVFKAVTATAALEEHTYTPGQTLYLPTSLELGGYTIQDAFSRGPVNWDMGKILIHSSNIGAVKIGMSVGAGKLNNWIRRFGFGSGTGIDFPGEATGIVLPTSQWSASTIGNVPIGQGISVTPLQMAVAYSAIANGGVEPKPYLVRSVGGKDEPAPPGKPVMSAATASQLTRYLVGVVDDGGAPAAQIDGYSIAGKTGTAQMVDPDGRYSNENYIGSFVGFVPAADPKLLVLVKVVEPHPFGGGMTVAAPAFQKITQFALQKLGISP